MKKLVALGISAIALFGCKPEGGGGNCAESWETVFGKQDADGAGCSAFIGTSAEVQPSFDWWGGQFHWKKPGGTNLKIEVKFSRALEDRDSPAGIHFRGGFFDVAKDKYYFWEGDDKIGVQPAVMHWTDWVATKVDITQVTTVAVRQKGVDVEGFINGALVGTFKLNRDPGPGPVGVDFKTPKGKTSSKVQFRDFSVTAL